MARSALAGLVLSRLSRHASLVERDQQHARINSAPTRADSSKTGRVGARHDRLMAQTPECTSISPYLRSPDGDAAAEWLTRVLGFGPARSVRGPDGSWAEGGVVVGPAHVDICGGHEPADKGEGALLIIGVSDVDAQ